ncbi:MAG: HDOD domain-containing protein, partial [Phycisphaerae bacterium]|nr:HDOD domain-containing protein [Phycisphaerae bacterium]
EQAVEAMGFETVRSAGLSTKVFETFETGGNAMDRPAFWQHCLAVASAAELIAEQIDLPAGSEETFVCGLLHDLGKLMLQHCLPKSYHRVLEAAEKRNADIADYERRIIGLDHCVVGRRLAEHWHLPGTIQEVIWLHHQPFEAIPQGLPARRLIAAVGLADTIARQQRFGFSGNYTFPRSSQEQARQLGLSPAALEEVTEALPERIQQRLDTLGLERVSGEGLYREALTSANAELGRLNEQLLRRAKKLSLQADAFAALRDFTAELTPEATTGEILLKAAKVTASLRDMKLSDSAPLVAYSLGGRDETVLALRWDGGEAVAWRTFAGAPVAGRQRTIRRVGPADEAVGSLLADPAELGEWLDPSAYEHQPLLCAGRWVGGVFCPTGGVAVGSEADEIAQAVIAA